MTSAIGPLRVWHLLPVSGNSLQRGEYWRALRNGCDESDLNEQPGRTTGAQATVGQQDKPPGMILETGSGKQDRPHTLYMIYSLISFERSRNMSRRDLEEFATTSTIINIILAIGFIMAVR